MPARRSGAAAASTSAGASGSGASASAAATEHKCDICKRAFATARTLKQHQTRSGPCVPQPDAPDLFFGSEIIEPLLHRLKPTDIQTLVKYPEEALTQDLPNLVFFNLDFPANQTVTWSDDQPAIFVLRNRETSAGKWRPVADKLQVIRVLARHYKKVVDHAKGQEVVTGLELVLANEYLKAIEEGKDRPISKYCPLYERVDDGVVCVQRMVERLYDVVRTNCELGKEDWVTTDFYARENLDP